MSKKGKKPQTISLADYQGDDNIIYTETNNNDWAADTPEEIAAAKVNNNNNNCRQVINKVVGDKIIGFRDDPVLLVPGINNNNNNNININIPDDMQPPYIAFVGNIPTALPESEVKNIFEPNNKVINIKVTTQEKSTFAFIEFGSINDLRNAINLSGKQVKNRNIKVDLASEGQKANMEKYMISRRNNNNNNNLNNKYNNNNIINRNTVRYPVPLEGVGLRISNTKY
eukprot:Tbor_TRINITY_DN5967_c2_g1::TRINITY_DN5967_c2_g1_i9::g.19060::m.19060